jgi:ORMDL family
MFLFFLCRMTFWEQIDDGVQFTATRKFFTIIPVVLFLLASNSSDFSRQPLGVNLIVVLVLLISKLSSMHDVRILGINRY